MKVKSDNRSKILRLGNWKEEAWRISGHQRDSNPWSPRNGATPFIDDELRHYVVNWSGCGTTSRSLFRKDNKTSLVKTFTVWQLRGVKLESLHTLESKTYERSQSWCCHNSLLIKPVKTKLLVLGTCQMLQRLPAATLLGKKVSSARALVFSKLYYFEPNY